jgi:hypothetical protein
VMTGRKVLLVPGNHDNRLAEPLLDQAALERRTLGLEQRAAPAGGAASQIADWLKKAELEIAYPGVWLRDDIYATHGHYMDCHRRCPDCRCWGYARHGVGTHVCNAGRLRAYSSAAIQVCFFGCTGGLVATGDRPV